jgi:ribonuclease Z
MTTHMPFDPYINEETDAEVREHWKGPFHFRAPDGIVVNVTKGDIWVREGVLPDYPNSRAPQFDFDDGQLVVPCPRRTAKKSRSHSSASKRFRPPTTTPRATTPSC